MKIKLMPLLAGLITLSAVATPLLVKAQANYRLLKHSLHKQPVRVNGTSLV
jgi:hypothetical protein